MMKPKKVWDFYLPSPGIICVRHSQFRSTMELFSSSDRLSHYRSDTIYCMNFRLVCLLPLFFLFYFPARQLQGQDAESILQSARMNPTSHPAAMRAQIRGDGPTTPLIIRLKDHVVSYEFTSPIQSIHLKLSPSETQLSEQINGVTKPISSAHRHELIRNTGLTYQDLSLGFLYWPLPIVQGEETIKTRPSWKIDLQAPANEPLYGVARVWIDKESGAILRIEGYDKKGLLIRRFEVISGQQIEGLWMLKQMRIENFAPGNPNPISRNYLEILGKE